MLVGLTRQNGRHIGKNAMRLKAHLVNVQHDTTDFSVARLLRFM